MSSSVQLFFGGSDEFNGDYSLIHKLAKAKRSVEWEAMKHSKEGDRALIYFNRPHSAIIASATLLEDSWPADDRPFRARIGDINILKDPISFDELTALFPAWDWLRYPRSKVYLDAAKGEKLWKRAGGESSRKYRRWRNLGAGFGDPESNRKVEEAAINRVTRLLKRDGYAVVSRESEGVGYDLEATRGSQVLHVEVKGISGTEIKFPITAGELNRAKEDPQFRLYAVTEARTRSAKVRTFRGRQIAQQFTVRPISYLAALD
jgi:hypothetical protein